jgi:hypothetical protein
LFAALIPKPMKTAVRRTPLTAMFCIAGKFMFILIWFIYHTGMKSKRALIML